MSTPSSNFNFPHSQDWYSTSPAIISQTQGDIDDASSFGSDDEDNYIAVPSDKLEHGKVTA